MEVDSGSSFEMPNGNKQKPKPSDEVEASPHKSGDISNESFIEDAIEIISCTSPSVYNNFSY